jgi:hypothetical protein
MSPYLSRRILSQSLGGGRMQYDVCVVVVAAVV